MYRVSLDWQNLDFEDKYNQVLFNKIYVDII